MYDWEGVSVFPPLNGIAENLVGWCNIILTHLEYTSWSCEVGKVFRKPVIYISHNTSFDAYNFLQHNPQVAIIYNSDAMKAQSPFSNTSFTLHPSVPVSKYAVNDDPHRAEYITMINCNENKGGKLFYKVAAAMPGRKFLAVKGSYDEQFIPDLPNVTVLENSPDILRVYRMTRILLMPSRYESWGMTATEAMCNGIPVIACPTFGLKENLGDAGIFVPARRQWDANHLTEAIMDDSNEYDVRPIIKAIKALDKPDTYRKWSIAGRKRAAELDPEKELGECENFLLNLLY